MSSPLNFLELVVGLGLLVVTFYDLFETVVLPRPAVRKVQLARYIIRPLWRVWRWVFNRGTHIDRSEARLGAYGPIALLTLFFIWAVSLITAYGLIIDGTGAEFHPPVSDFSTAFYVSATTLVPLSYGDIVPLDGPARFVIVLESATGVAFAALAITLLFELYGSFQEREEAVVSLDALAGAPPSAVQLLETSSQRGMDDVLKQTFEEWNKWSAMVLETHLAYPVLVFFRSSHDNEAWVNSFAAVMDAAALIMSSTDDATKGVARLMFTVGSHLVEDMTWLFRLKTANDPIIERAEFKAAIARLRTAGYIAGDGDAEWEQFAYLRSKYASSLNQIAQVLAAPPAQWVGDRSYLPHRQRPRRRRQPVGTAAS